MLHMRIIANISKCVKSIDIASYEVALGLLLVRKFRLEICMEGVFWENQAGGVRLVTLGLLNNRSRLLGEPRDSIYSISSFRF
jgi:hypothetical protein